MCTRVKYLTPVPSDKNPDYIKYLHLQGRFTNNLQLFTLVPSTGQNILRGVFGDSLLSRWKQLVLLQRDSKQYSSELNQIRNIFCPVVDIVKLTHLELFILAVSNDVKQDRKSYTSLQDLFTPQMLTDINNYKIGIGYSTSELLVFVVFIHKCGIDPFELLGRKFNFTMNFVDHVGEDSDLYMGLAAINNVIQRMPIWDQKHALGDISLTTNELELRENITQIGNLLPTLNDIKIGDGDQISPKDIPELQAKFFQLYDSLIPKPGDAKIAGDYSTLESIITESLIEKVKLPDVIIGIIEAFSDPFDLVLYNQGDSKIRFKLAKDYFKERGMNSDFILGISRMFRNSLGMDSTLAELIGCYLGFFGEAVRKFDKLNNELKEAGITDYYQLPEDGKAILYQHDNETKTYNGLIYGGINNEVTRTFQSNEITQTWRDSDISKIKQMREDKIQTLLETTMYFIFLIDGDNVSDNVNSEELLQELIDIWYNECILRYIYDQRRTVGFGDQHTTSPQEMERTYILFNMLSQRGLDMGRIADDKDPFGNNHWGLGIYCNEMWEYLPLAIRSRMQTVQNGGREAVEIISNIIMHEVFMKHDHYSKDHIQMLKDVRSILEELI